MLRSARGAVGRTVVGRRVTQLISLSREADGDYERLAKLEKVRAHAVSLLFQAGTLHQIPYTLAKHV